MKKRSDRFLLGIVGVLTLFGFFMLTSAFLGPAAKKTDIFYTSLLRQILIGVLGGGILFLITSYIPYKKWQKISLPLFLFTLFFTFLVFVPPIGFEHAGAKRWINLGFTTFQPSELLKFGFMIYLASWLASRKEEVSSLKFGFLPFLLIVAFTGVVLIMEPNMSTLIIMGLTAVAMFFIAGGRFKQIATLILFIAVVFVIIATLFPNLGAYNYLKKRITVFINPAYDLQGSGYQLNQSKIALGSGGIFGKGFGMSIQKFSFLPEPTGDSIFAVIGEEFGFIGTTALIFLFLLFLYRGLLVSSRAPDSFGRLLGSGIVIMIISQSFMNMAAMIGIFPLTGLPLLFISQGGSALALTLAEVGVLLNISKFQKI